MRTDKFVYNNNEILKADIEVAHFGAKTLKQAEIVYTLKDEYGKVYAQGTLATQDIPIGNLNHTGSLEFPLTDIQEAKKLNLEIRITQEQKL